MLSCRRDVARRDRSRPLRGSKQVRRMADFHGSAEEAASSSSGVHEHALWKSFWKSITFTLTRTAPLSAFL